MPRAVRSGRCMARPHGASCCPRPNRCAALEEPRPASTTQLRHVLGCRAFLSLHDVELDALPLTEGLEAAAFDGRMMNEAILLSILRRDEAEALLIVEPLDGTGRTHCPNSMRCVPNAKRACSQFGRPQKRSETVHAHRACFA